MMIRSGNLRGYDLRHYKKLKVYKKNRPSKVAL